jgi:hypothetical protein
MCRVELLIARNPDPESALPFLLRLPIAGGLVFRVKDTWPRTNAVFCYPVAVDEWPRTPDVVERVALRVCERRGAAIDIVAEAQCGVGSGDGIGLVPQSGHIQQRAQDGGDRPAVEQGNVGRRSLGPLDQRIGGSVVAELTRDDDVDPLVGPDGQRQVPRPGSG